MSQVVAVVTDTCACLPPPMAADLGVEVVPYYIHRSQETLRDLVDVQPDEFYRWLPQAAELPKTANPGPGDYIRAFQNVRGRGLRQATVICMTSKGSGAYQSACVAKEMAAQELPEMTVDVIDTLRVSMAHGWAVIEAARVAQAGASQAEVRAAADGVASKAVMIQTADTLRYLYMGGRIGRAQHLVGSLLRIKPLIGMEDGIITPLGTARSRGQAYARMVELIAEQVGPGGRIKVAYMHAAALADAEKLRRLVEARLTCVETIVTQLNPALGVHTGPGMVGLAYYPV
ncbi:MAG: DegV family protein [Chloroflexi bacterium]|nr:DegV family protein [Chloroflexota bacterium]